MLCTVPTTPRAHAGTPWTLPPLSHERLWDFLRPVADRAGQQSRKWRQTVPARGGKWTCSCAVPQGTRVSLEVATQPSCFQARLPANAVLRPCQAGTSRQVSVRGVVFSSVPGVWEGREDQGLMDGVPGVWPVVWL